MRAREGGSEAWQGHARLRLRPSSRILLAADGSYTRATDDFQYVTTAQAQGNPRWVLGRIDQSVWSLTFRANLTVTPELTVQYYGSPFFATGRFGAFKQATDTLAPVYENRFHRYGDTEIVYRPADDTYRISEAGSGATYGFANPDFSFRQFRSNLVVRWEYRPGSSLYAVWSQGRTGYGQEWDGTFRGNWNGLLRARPDNAFLIKLSYWISP
jgi:hypothetical protein